MTRRTECTCGSGLYPEKQFDGHGIFLCYTCNVCEGDKMAGYRPDIHERYECDEPIEPEDQSQGDVLGLYDEREQP